MGHANAEGILEAGPQVCVYYQGITCHSILKVKSSKSHVSLWEIHQINSNFLESSSLERREPTPCLQPQFLEQSLHTIEQRTF